jgi:hypothetical protein
MIPCHCKTGEEHNNKMAIVTMLKMATNGLDVSEKRAAAADQLFCTNNRAPAAPDGRDDEDVFLHPSLLGQRRGALTAVKRARSAVEDLEDLSSANSNLSEVVRGHPNVPLNSTACQGASAISADDGPPSDLSAIFNTSPIVPIDDGVRNVATSTPVNKDVAAVDPSKSALTMFDQYISGSLKPGELPRKSSSSKKEDKSNSKKRKLEEEKGAGSTSSSHKSSSKKKKKKSDRKEKDKEKEKESKKGSEKNRDEKKKSKDKKGGVGDESAGEASCTDEQGISTLAAGGKEKTGSKRIRKKYD